MDILFGLMTCVAILLAKMLIWAPFSKLITFSFYINPWILTDFLIQIKIYQYLTVTYPYLISMQYILNI